MTKTKKADKTIKAQIHAFQRYGVKNEGITILSLSAKNSVGYPSVLSNTC